MYLFLAFVLVPIVEIALFIQVGGAIGLWPTLGIVVLTAILGTWMVRAQGRMALQQLQASFSELNDPTEPLVHGAMILVSGVLLLTPGFFTDGVGFALLLPPVRVAVFRFFKSRVRVQGFQMGGNFGQQPRQTRNSDIIEGEYEEVTPTKPTTEKPSGWVQGPDQH